MLLSRFLNAFIRIGRLSVIDANGHTHVFEGSEGPSVTIRLHDKSLHWKLFVRPDLYAGEAYTDGTLTVEGASVYEFLDIVGRNVEASVGEPFGLVMTRIDRMMRGLHTFNPAITSRQNVAHHYDLSDRLYELFLGSERQYSCAYFARPDDSLDLAQLQKCRHITAKLLLQPDMNVLDIGCGWGGLAMYVARHTGARVTGITLSKEQLAMAKTRSERTALADRVEFHLRDYREQQGRFDRIVSIGMFEHVGVGHYKEFFRTIRSLLTDDGVALVHTIGRADGPGTTNPWLRKYIFPGGYVPALSEVAPAIERAGLWITDIEVLRLHYAETLRHWRQRFLARRDEALAAYDERFCRMWEFYLALCEISFRYVFNNVFQIQLSKRQEAVPLTRDYIMEAEQALQTAEREANHRAA